MTVIETPIRLLAVLGEYPADELRLREEAMLAAAPPGVELGFGYIEHSVFKKGLTHLHRAMTAPAVARVARDAEREGYQGVVPYGTLDLGVEESRHVVDIPVVGPGRTAAVVASSLAERFVVIVYDKPHVIMQTSLLRFWGVSDRVTSIRAVDLLVTNMAANPERLRERFVEQAQAAIRDEGAQLVVPMGLTMVPVLMSPAALAADIGVPVVDPMALSLQLAASLARAGTTNSRAAYPAVTLD